MIYALNVGIPYIIPFRTSGSMTSEVSGPLIARFLDVLVRRLLHCSLQTGSLPNFCNQSPLYTRFLLHLISDRMGVASKVKDFASIGITLGVVLIVLGAFATSATGQAATTINEVITGIATAVTNFWYLIPLAVILGAAWLYLRETKLV